MSEQSRGAAWWPRPRSLCTAAAAAWYVRAMYEQHNIPSSHKTQKRPAHTQILSSSGGTSLRTRTRLFS
jgi:hypothetical protein